MSVGKIYPTTGKITVWKNRLKPEIQNIYFCVNIAFGKCLCNAMAVFPLETYVEEERQKQACGNVGWISATAWFTAEKYTQHFGVFCFNKPSEAGIFTSAFKLALHLLCCMRTDCVCIYYPHDECQKRQNANSSCSQLKLDWKTCQGTVEQPQFSASYWRTRGLCFQLQTHTHPPPQQVPKQTHHTLRACLARLSQGPGLSNAALGGSADCSTAEVWDHFWTRWSQTTSAHHLLGCIGLGKKWCKKPACTEQLKPSEAP